MADMQPRERLGDYLLGVRDVDLYATLGSPNKPPSTWERRHITRANLRAVVPCPNGCHEGGFDLARDLHDRLVTRQKVDGEGIVRCSGHVDLDGGRRQACDAVLQYRALLAYSSRNF